MPTQESIQVSYQLVPTTMTGAFISPAPPADFDPNTATPRSLIENGFPWRRLDESSDPVLRAVWQHAFSRQWRAEDRLIPELAPQPGKTHKLKSAEQAADGSYTDPQWAGSVVPGTWTGAIGYWVVPTVAVPGVSQGTEGGWNSSSWVGLDGAFGSDDVLQAGVEQCVDAEGNPSYVAWFEWYAPRQSGSPDYIYQVNIPNFTVAPGQGVYCSVQYVNGKTAGRPYFANDTTGEHFSITLAPPPGATFDGNTAEWIMEAPDGGESVSSLPAFTPVTFTDAICCGSTLGNPQNGDIFNIVGFGVTLTSVTVGSDTVTITYIGP